MAKQIGQFAEVDAASRFHGFDAKRDRAMALTEPLGIQAALDALDERRAEDAEKRQQIELALEQARFEAARAQRQYDAVAPAGRLVAVGLEQRWNSRLIEVQKLEQELERLFAAPAAAPTQTERTRLLSLGADVEQAWASPAALLATRKRIIRTLIDKIVVRMEDSTLAIVICWNGGDHTSLRVANDPAPKLSSLITRIRSGCGPSWTGLRTRSA